MGYYWCEIGCHHEAYGYFGGQSYGAIPVSSKQHSSEQHIQFTETRKKLQLDRMPIQKCWSKSVVKQSVKRKPNENSPNVNAPKPKFNASKPKIGTKPAVTGLKIVARPKKIERPKYSKAVWVSRFDASSTNEDICNYIMDSSPIDDKAKINVHKLVKRGQDLSFLNFVSLPISKPV